MTFVLILPPAGKAAELTLAHALDTALERNRSLTSAQARVAEQEAALEAARADRWPSLDFSQRLTRIDGNTVNRANSAAEGLSQLIGIEIPPFVYEDGYRTQFELAVPLWTSGGLAASIAAERESLNARRADQQAARRATRTAVVRGFFALAAAGEVRLAREQAFDRAERRLAETEHRLEVGLTTRQEVLRWQVEVEGARADLAASEADAFVARLELADVLELGPKEIGEPRLPAAELVDSLLAWADGLDPYDVLARAEDELDTLPEVRSAQAQAAVAESAIRGARAVRRPRLDAAAAYGWLENDTLDLDEFENWSATLHVSVPIDLRGRLRAQIARSTAQRTVAETAVADTRAAMRLALGRALAEVIRARTRLRSARRAADEAAARRELLARQTEVGLTGLLDLIDADTTLVAAEVARATARVELLAAVAALEITWPGADPPGGGLIP
ncbi:MAG: TolC family protein [bacterium]|nr:TolC family protein [bacterium]